MSEELTREEVHHAADRLVEEVLEGAGLREPPLDALALARHLGLEIRPEQIRRGRSKPEPLPLAEMTEERRQSVAALALADHFENELLERLGIEPGGPLRGESLTNLLAQRLLVPTPWLAAEARACGYDLFELKDRFRTAGHDLIAFRLLDLDEPCAITLVESGRVSKRRSNAYPITRELVAAEAACLRQVQRYSRLCRVRDDGWDVRGWPLHEADWKREVLRSVYEDQ